MDIKINLGTFLVALLGGFVGYLISLAVCESNDYEAITRISGISLVIGAALGTILWNRKKGNQDDEE